MSTIHATDGALHILLTPAASPDSALNHTCTTLAEAIDWIRAQGCDPVERFGLQALLDADAAAVAQRPPPPPRALAALDAAPTPKRTRKKEV